MTYLFRTLRIYGYSVVLGLSAAVLGLSAYFATIFLPSIHKDFTIFSLAVPSFTIATLLILLLWYSNPRIEALFFFITAVSWIAMGAWSRDLYGPAECFALADQRIRTQKGSINARSYCYEAKIVEAFSWSLFGILTIFLIMVIALATKCQAVGRHRVWSEHINELPWFGQLPGSSYYPHHYGGLPQNGEYPATYLGAGGIAGGPNIVQQQYGHSIIIRPGVNGEPAQITQVPGIVHNA
ncbi:hypothetical protein BV25DRAFT_54514 [Artomyces pyxidatus]|uniref:Uncharacterized protein n=1 Tax=Artomyces pyxidatus TaxID=48021 RepID=A0ACB8TKB0_9AGAM|nr:hypothetical protein BV25DRAFT_54514 [Artomyces pyxidatus]